MKTFWRLPKTYCFFPVPQENEQPVARPGDISKTPRGVALIIAIMAVSMIMVLASTLIVTSSVTLQLAQTGVENIKAEYLAKTGFNVALFFYTIDWAADLTIFQQTKTVPVDGSSDVWMFLNGFSISSETVEMMSKFQEQFGLSGVNDETTLNLIKQLDGGFTTNLEDEQAKVNVTACNLAINEGTCADSMLFLEALFSAPAERALLEKKNLKPKELAYRIKDWVDKNTTPEESGLNSEDDPYEKQTPPYSSKNVPMESVNELKLIEGWDDDIHAVFSKYISVYPYIESAKDARPININNVPKEFLSSIFPEAKGECADKYNKKLLDDEDKDTRANAASSRDGVKQFIADKLCPKNGDKAEAFTYRSTVFRFKIRGESGNQERNLEVVVERGMPDKTKKIDRSYNILYWKMR